ncbi:MAG: endonuclease/exonuclease/phosphatase family protein [Rubrivivax sp.]|jgi:endonuclease/exonuclease/phosphatase family metal-dependent hydrolase|nr:endonuclease/exonuclease/phosphatase family protein [Rubrivivax sp.]
MSITLGTFNLNNLFSRYNFQAEVPSLPAEELGGIELRFAPGAVRARTFMGRLVKAKDPAATAEIARRIVAMDLDVLAVQEVEHIEILREFNRVHLGGLYRHVVLIEGNDPRMIDVGVLSKLPIGPVVSYQAATHPDAPQDRVFGRDLLAVRLLDPDGRRLLTLYNTHLKSHYVPPGEEPVEGAARAAVRRRRQAETIAAILSGEERRGARFVLVGDMNDPPDSPSLAPMLTADGDALVDGLADAAETRPARPEAAGQGPGPATARWTHRYNPPGSEPPRYQLFDQIWLSASLAPRLLSAHIDRRTRHGGDGSDHDPAWVTLDL